MGRYARANHERDAEGSCEREHDVEANGGSVRIWTNKHHLQCTESRTTKEAGYFLYLLMHHHFPLARMPEYLSPTAFLLPDGRFYQVSFLNQASPASQLSTPIP